jgi:hypothetical protein
MENFTNIINNYKPSLAIVDSKPQPLADKIRIEVEPYCKNTKFLYLDAKGKKGSMLAQLIEAVDKGTIVIPSIFKQLIRELENYNRSKDRNINLVDALLLAYYQSLDTQPPIETPRCIYFPPNYNEPGGYLGNKHHTIG